MFFEKGEVALQETSRDARGMRVSSRVKCFFRDAIGASVRSPDLRDNAISEIITRFRDLLADEEEGDDRFVAQALRDCTYNFVDKYGFTTAREVVIRILCESAIAMNIQERDELRCFAVDFYFDDEDDGHAFISSSDRSRFTRELVDSIVAADEIHRPDIFEGSEDEVHRHELIEREFKNLVDTLHFEGNVEELRNILLLAFSSRGELTERNHARIVEILREEGEIWRGVMLARSLEFFNPGSRAPAQRIQELRRLKSEEILFSQETFLEENIRSAIRAVFERRIAYPGTRFSFENFFPGERRVSEETVWHFVKIISERIIFDLPDVLKGLGREFIARPADHAHCVEILFSSIHCFTSEFLRQIPPSRESEARKLFEDALVQGGGDAYVQWQEHERLKREASRVRSDFAVQESIHRILSSPVSDPAPVRISSFESTLPPVAPMVHTSPLVISPFSHAESPGFHERKDEKRVDVREQVLARIAAGELLHLAEDIRKHPRRFADALRDYDVQSAAWRALEQAMGRGLFGVVERAAPIFLGEDWKKEDSSLRFLAQKYFVQELIAERRGDVGHRLPEAVLKQKALGFGFDWDELVAEAVAQLPKKAKKRK